MAWYNTGTVTVTNGSPTITGSGTDFVANTDAGQSFIGPNGIPYEILTVNSATSLTLATNYVGTTAAGQAYRIMPVQGYLRDTATQLASLVLTYSAVVTGIGAGKFPDGTVGAPGVRFANDEDTGIYRPGANIVAIATNGTERVRVDAAGNISIGDTSTGGYKFAVIGNFGQLVKSTGGSSNEAQVIWNNATTGNNILCYFATEGSITVRGSITYNRGAGLIAYNTTSDYRSKVVHGPLSNSGEVIDRFRVYLGTMRAATQARPMLVAHEAQEVAPYCVTGEKDAVDKNGDPVFQQMDHSSLVPLLIAEIQSLRARVAALEKVRA